MSSNGAREAPQLIQWSGEKKEEKLNITQRVRAAAGPVTPTDRHIRAHPITLQTKEGSNQSNSSAGGNKAVKKVVRKKDRKKHHLTICRAAAAETG